MFKGDSQEKLLFQIFIVCVIIRIENYREKMASTSSSIYSIKLINCVTSLQKDMQQELEVIEEAAGGGTTAEILQLKDSGSNNVVDLKVKFNNDVKMKTISLKADTVCATFEAIEKAGMESIPGKVRDPLISDRIDGMLKLLQKQELTINHTSRVIQQLVAENIRMKEENGVVRSKLTEALFDIAQLKRKEAKCMPMQMPMPLQIPRPIPGIGYPIKKDDRMQVANSKLGNKVYVSILLYMSSQETNLYTSHNIESQNGF